MNTTNDTIWDIISEIDNFTSDKYQLDAIKARNFNKASELGVTIDQYLAYISPNYRAKLIHNVA